ARGVRARVPPRSDRRRAHGARGRRGRPGARRGLPARLAVLGPDHAPRPPAARGARRASARRPRELPDAGRARAEVPDARAPLAVLALLAGPARATTFVGVSERILARAADAIVIGTVEQIETVAGGDGTISTLVTLDVEEAVKGHVERRLTLKQPGGSIGGRTLWIAGGPRFRTGERQLLFLSAAADGTARTTALGMGQFLLRAHPRTGATLAEPRVDGL